MPKQTTKKTVTKKTVAKKTTAKKLRLLLNMLIVAANTNAVANVIMVMHLKK